MWLQNIQCIWKGDGRKGILYHTGNPAEIYMVKTRTKHVLVTRFYSASPRNVLLHPIFVIAVLIHYEAPLSEPSRSYCAGNQPPAHHYP